MRSDRPTCLRAVVPGAIPLIGFAVAILAILASVVGDAGAAPNPPGVTERVSVGISGGKVAEANGQSFQPSISSTDGRYVAFASAATNLVDGQVTTRPGVVNVYRYDRQEHTTVLVSEAFATSTPAPGTATATPAGSDQLLGGLAHALNIHVGSLVDGGSTTTVPSKGLTLTMPSSQRESGNGDSGQPSISADGNYVAFTSKATNLVPPLFDPDDEGTDDVFVRDIVAGTTRLVTESCTFGEGLCVARYAYGGYSPAISADATFIAFVSPQQPAPPIPDFKVNVYVWNRTTGAQDVEFAGVESREGTESEPSISENGRFVAFASTSPDVIVGDTNSASDVFVRDRQERTTTRVSVAGDGQQWARASRHPSISGDGRFVAFESRPAGSTTCDGTEIYVRDRDADGNDTRDEPGNDKGRTDLITVAADGSPSGQCNRLPAIAADADWITWTSAAKNLLSEPLPTTTTTTTTTTTPVTTRGTCGPGVPCKFAVGGATACGGDFCDAQVFVRSRTEPTIEQVSTSTAGLAPNETSIGSTITRDGRFVGFGSDASNLIDTDENRVRDVFVRERRPVLAVTPVPGTFPPTRTGESFTRVFTLENKGPGGVKISSVAIAGANGTEFAKVDDKCSDLVLAAKTTCTVTVRFRPETPGDRSGELVFIHDAPTSPLFVPLSGTGTAPAFSASPNPGDFGSRPVGTSQPLTFRVRNAGNAPLAVSNVAVVGGNVDDFAVVAGGQRCTAQPVPAGAGCDVSVTFRPGADGPRSSELVFTDDAAGSPHRIPLSGSGTVAGILVTPDPGDFGNTMTGRATPVIFTVRSVGSAPLTVNAVTVEGADAGEFTIDKDGDACSGASFDPQALCTVAMTFRPTQPGERTAQLVFADNAPGGPHRVPIKGMGTTPGITVSPDPADFGRHPLGTPVTITFTAESVGTAPLTIAKVTVSGPDASSFAVGPQNCVGARLPPTASCTVEVTFVAARAADRLARLVFTDDAPGTPHAVPLAGTGVAPPKDPAIVVTPDPGDFGEHPVGSSTSLEFTARSVGEKPLQISAVYVDGPNTGEFAVTPGADSCRGATLPRGATCRLVVTFAPSSVGNRGAELVFRDNAPGSPQRVPVRGGGLGVGQPPGDPSSSPRITIDPPVAPAGTVVTVRGTGFLPNASVNLRWTIGTGTGSPTTDGQGNFETSLLILHNDPLGWRVLEADDGRSRAVDNELVVAPEVQARRFVQRG